MLAAIRDAGRRASVGSAVVSDAQTTARFSFRNERASAREVRMYRVPRRAARAEEGGGLVTCETCGKPATYGVYDSDQNGDPGEAHYFCEEHEPTFEAHCRDCYFEAKEGERR
jgi:hypothetical protein